MFRRARERRDHTEPLLEDFVRLVRAILALSPPCTHGLVEAVHCALCHETWARFSDRCHDLLNTYNQGWRWITLAPKDMARLLRIVATILETLQAVVRENRVPRDLWYLWISSTVFVRASEPHLALIQPVDTTSATDECDRQRDRYSREGPRVDLFSCVSCRISNWKDRMTDERTADPTFGGRLNPHAEAARAPQPGATKRDERLERSTST